MRLQNNPDKLQNQFVQLHHQDWLEKQRVAGQALADVMQILQQLVADKTTMTLKEIDKLVDDEVTKRNCYPTFKNFKGFPGAICLSVNKQLVHGIPSDDKLQEGDVVSFDFGCTYEGAIADSAVTMVYGEPIKKDHVRLIEATRDCLYNSIKAIAVGKPLGVIGNTIYRTAKQAGFNVITKFGGHGITWNKPHAPPFVPNRDLPEEGIHIQPGLTIAIEPLLVPGNCTGNTRINDDGWTVCTEDIGAHFEHSLYVHKDHVEIISWRSEEAPLIDKKVYFS